MPKLQSDADPKYVDEIFKNMSPRDSSGESIGKEENQLFSSILKFNLEFSYDHEQDLQKNMLKMNVQK